MLTLELARAQADALLHEARLSRSHAAPGAVDHSRSRKGITPATRYRD